ncbi:hypothetical protein ABPG72_001576 [Tetrahymena utriculariae]
MSKRPGEDIQGNDPQKKLKTTDLPTAPTTANKISYGSLKPPTSSGSSISYAAFKKQQLSTMKQPAKPVSSSQVSQSIGSSQIPASAVQNNQNTTKQLVQQSSSQAQDSKIIDASSQNEKKQDTVASNKNENISEQSQNKFSEAQPTVAEKQGQQAAPKTIDLKSQQQQIIERAKKLREEEKRLAEFKKNSAVIQKVQNAQQGLKPGQPSSISQTKIQKELKKKEEKKPLTKQEQEMKQLQEFAKRKEKEQKLIEKLLKEGKIKPEDLEKSSKKEEIKIDSKEKEVRLDDEGNLIDAKGNIVVIDSNKSTLKINQQKKQLDKLTKMARNARFQNSQVFQDSSIFTTTSLKRERKKMHALNFIEDTNQLQDEKEEYEEKMDVEDESEDDQSCSDSSESEEKIEQENQQNDQNIEKNDDFRQLIQKTEIDYRREDFQKTNSKYLQSLHKKKQSLKQKHHDPIPDIEWWDLPLFDNNRRYYLPLDQANQTIAQQAIQAGGESNSTTDNNPENQTANENNLSINILDNLEIIKQLLAKLQVENFEYSKDYYRQEKITNLIEHPKPFKNDGLPNSNQLVVIPNYLTKKEQKKLSRRHRLEKEKEKQDKIKLGLITPPPPKVRLKNMMRVLGNEAVADPTKMEALVRQGVAERLQEHLRRNQERQLTKEQKAEKFLRKLKRDSAIECRVALFRIENLQDRVHKFKVDINAQQMQLHGALIYPVVNPESRSTINMPAIVLVEGGPKAIKFYKKLMLRRIKWDKNSYLPKDENGEIITPVDLSDNKCALVWEGVVKDHNFNKWKVHDVDSEVEARRVFTEKNVEFYFDMAINYQYPN